MPPLSLSAGVRKARELGRRRLSLALARPRMVSPSAHYRLRPIDGVIVLQRGENASTDYYLRPRLERLPVETRIVDLESTPSACDLLAAGGGESLLVILCRYAARPWLEALDAARSRLARVAFFMDDDLPEMMRDPELPQAARGKVAAHFGEHVEALGRLASEVWASSPALAARYPEARPAVLEPIPDADPPAPAMGAPMRVVYHGTDVHRRERRFVLEVARRMAALGCEAVVEIVGDAALARAAAGLPSVSVIPQQPWPEYRRRQSAAAAAICLAPLHPSTVNGARAPVKAFDAARLGAAGLYADAEPYRGFVRDGVDGLLLPMEPQAWAEAAVQLMAQPDRRLALAEAARARLTLLRHGPIAFPAAPDA